MTSRGICNAAGTAFASAAKRSRVGRSARLSPRIAGNRRRMRASAARARSVSTSSLRPKRRIVIWNGCGRPAAVERDRFAVEDQLPRGQRASGFDDLGNRGGDIVQAARVDAHRRRPPCAPGCARRPSSTRMRPRRRAARSASAGSAAVCASIGAIGERISSWNLARPAVLASSSAARATAPDALRVHRGAAHLRDRQIRGCRDRVDHHARERALTELADQKPDQESCSAAVASANSSRRRRATAGRCARAANACDLAQAPVDFADRQCRLRERATSAARVSQQGVADTEASLRGFAGKILRHRSRSRRARAARRHAASSRTFARRAEVAPTRCEAFTRLASKVTCTAPMLRLKNSS